MANQLQTRLRASRWFSQADELGRHVGDSGSIGVGLDIGQGGRQHLVDVTAVGAHAGYGELRELPEVPLTDLGGGDLEFRPNPTQQAADDLPLGLQRTALREVEDHPRQADRDRGGLQISFFDHRCYYTYDGR